MSTDTEIRTTLHRAAEAADAPTIDRNRFERRVRRHRHRRRAGMAGAAAAVAAAALAVPLAVDRMGTETKIDTPPPPLARPLASLSQPVYFAVTDRQGFGHVMAIDPRGQVHDLSVRTEEILGLTYDGVILIGAESQLVRIRATAQPDGQWRFDRVPLPVKGAFGVAKPSDDGFMLLASPLYGEPAIYDLATDKVVSRPDLPAESGNVEDFDGQRILFNDGDSTWLYTGDGNPIELPDALAPPSMGGDFVLVPQREGVRLYDVSSGSAEKIGEVDGYIGELSPDGRYYFAASEEPAGPVELWELGADEPTLMSGAPGKLWDARWLDADTALVGSSVERNGKALLTLLVCEAQTRACGEIYATTDNIWLRY
jgi:hypothetical protein